MINVLRKAVIVTLTTVLLLAAPAKAFAADKVNVLNDSEWNSFVEEKIDLDTPPGLAVAAVDGSKVSFRNWGYGNLEEQTPVTEDTVFGIASCSKAFLLHLRSFCCRRRTNSP